MKQEIYLDNAATTRIDGNVLKAMEKVQKDNYGNPGSQHSLGKRAKEVIEDARKVIAEHIGASPEEIIFTSGGTESNNLAIRGAPSGRKICSAIEHKSVLETCKAIGNYETIPVDQDGLIAPAVVREMIDHTRLVSVMIANNETGVIQPIQEIGTICRHNEVLFHVDAAQAITKIPINVNRMDIDLLTISGHKIHGPKGVGALYVRKGTTLWKFITGGTQEKGMRAGTENVAGIAGLAEAIRSSDFKDSERMAELRDMMIDELLKIEDSWLNGPRERLCNNINMGFKDVDNEKLMKHLDSKGVYISTGSACTAQEITPSHVLKAMGLSDDKAMSSVRITLSKHTTKDEVKKAVKAIREVVEDLRKVS